MSFVGSDWIDCSFQTGGNPGGNTTQPLFIAGNLWQHTFTTCYVHQGAYGGAAVGLYSASNSDSIKHCDFGLHFEGLPPIGYLFTGPNANRVIQNCIWNDEAPGMTGSFFGADTGVASVTLQGCDLLLGPGQAGATVFDQPGSYVYSGDARISSASAWNLVGAQWQGLLDEAGQITISASNVPTQYGPGLSFSGGVLDVAVAGSSAVTSNAVPGQVNGVTLASHPPGVYGNLSAGTVPNPTFVFDAPPAGGVRATGIVSAMYARVVVQTAPYFLGGANYSVGDVLTMQGGVVTAGGSPYAFMVTGIDANGAITAFKPVTAGSYATVPAMPASYSGGTGAGAQSSQVGFSVLACAITNPGSGYLTPPNMTFSGALRPGSQPQTGTGDLLLTSGGTVNQQPGTSMFSMDATAGGGPGGNGIVAAANTSGASGGAGGGGGGRFKIGPLLWSQAGVVTASIGAQALAGSQSAGGSITVQTAFGTFSAFGGGAGSSGADGGLSIGGSGGSCLGQGGNAGGGTGGGGSGVGATGSAAPASNGQGSGGGGCTAVGVAGNGGASIGGATGGGGGGGINSADAATAGATGGPNEMGRASGGAPGANGTNGQAPPQGPGTGGGGGGGSVGGQAGNGGNGGPGAGGGGGGSSSGTGTAGLGGNGGPPVLAITQA